MLVDTTWCHDFAISGGDINPMTGQKRRSKEDLEEETLWRGMKVVRGA